MSATEYGLAQRLKELNLTSWDLAKAYCKSIEVEPTRENTRKYHTQIKRVIDNPESISLGNYRKIIALVGGQIQHDWINKEKL